jgi:hypothetical protein
VASTDPWWVIVATNYGSAPSYTYFQGTQAQAQAKSNVVEVSTQQNLFGPYDTKAEAQAAAQGQGANPVTAPTPGGGSNPLAPFSDVSHALTAFYRTVTDGKLWRSLGWLLLGVLLLFTGIGLLIGPAAARRSPAGVVTDFARKAYG